MSTATHTATRDSHVHLSVGRVRLDGDLSIPTGATVTVTGSRPLVVIASGAIDVGGLLDAGAHGVAPGPGGDAAGAGLGHGGDGAHAGTYNDGGGGGATYGQAGGAGGGGGCPATGTCAAVGGSPGTGYGDATIAVLYGGSGGGSPALKAGCTQGAAGGGGGGAGAGGGTCLWQPAAKTAMAELKATSDANRRTRVMISPGVVDGCRSLQSLISRCQ